MTDTRNYLDISGGKRLNGEVRISGSKNACLPIMAATLLVKGTCHLENVPRLRDVFTLAEVLRSLGGKVEWTGDNSISIDSTQVSCLEPDPDLVNKMRASVLVMGPLFARFGQAMIPLPGGCSLGKRPIDLHLKGMECLGGTVVDHPESVTVRLHNGSRPKSATVKLDFPSVGATENIIMAAALADGTTVIENAAREPEIVDLADFIISMGAHIKGAGEETVTVIGVKELHPANHRVIPDRIETATYLLSGAITGGTVTAVNARHDHLTAVLDKLAETGCRITTESNRVTVEAPDVLRRCDIRTHPYPGFATDVQPQFMALMTKAAGDSIFVEKIFERRFLAADELKRMGAEIRIVDSCALVSGGTRLVGCEVNAPDIRAAAALLIGALWAEGTTRIRGLNHLYRGYERPVQKLSGLGAEITESEPAQQSTSGIGS